MIVPERPLLNLPAPTRLEPPRRYGGGAPICRPSRDRQRERIDPKFARLSAAAETPADLLALRNDPASIAPERAIVFEVEGSLEDFYEQARVIGLEYLGDFEEEFDPTDDFYNTKDPEQKLSGRIYLAMPDAQSLKELLSLWARYTQNQNMPKGRSQWRELFSRLIDVRAWGPQDRIVPGATAAWEDDLAREPDLPVRLEIELWFYKNPAQRAQTFERLQADIAAAGGHVVHHATIPEIYYDAALIDLPGVSVRALIDHPAVSLARADEVMFLRPQSVARHPGAEEFTGEDCAAASSDAEQAEPIAALLDGLPIQNHVRLAGRLVVDDPEGLENIYPVARREHGTEMASLIIHGDLNLGEAPLPRRLYVRPVMRPAANGDERTPSDRLLADVIHQAVRRIKEGDGMEPPAAPGVVVVNLSLGDEKRPYAHAMSPLGRLLDYLSHRYRVLFLVSAGNIMDRLPVAAFGTSIEFEIAAPEAREAAILAALNANKSRRTLFSPAESLNTLTIGAANSGSAFTGNLPNGRIDPFTNEELPNIVSAMGLGFKKVIKPELLFAGGRTPVSVVASGGGGIVIAPVRAGARFFGLKAARPSPVGGTRYEDFTWGTSAATALATRGAHRIYDVLTDAVGGSNHTDIEPAYMPLVLKALLVHGAQWGPKGNVLDGSFQPQGTGSHFARRDDISRLLGYGVPKIDRVLDCAKNRATLLGVGAIEPETSLLYRIPLPDGLDGVRALRAVTITLAWFSPVNPRHQGYRVAALDVAAGSDQKYWIAPERSLQPTDKATARGTIFHERRMGEVASVFVDDGHLLLRLTCRAAAGNLSESVPYALAISIEVGVDTWIPVYDQVQSPARAARACRRVSLMSSTGTITYRVRFRFRVQVKLAISEHEYRFKIGEKDAVLSSPLPDGPISESEWLIITVRGFDNQTEAEKFGRNLKTSAQLSSVASRQGIDPGTDRFTASFSQELKNLLFEKHGVINRNNVHGIDVFPDDPRVSFIGINATGVVSRSPDPFLSDLGLLMDGAENISQSAMDVILLLNHALMRPEPVAQIVFAISAVEMLGQNESWSADQERILNDLAAQAGNSAIGTEFEREEIVLAIRKSLHKLTLRQGVVRLLDDLGLSHLKKEWDGLYGERSKLVHGLAPKPGTDYTPLAAKAVNLCGRILIAAVAKEVPLAASHAERFYPTDSDSKPQAECVKSRTGGFSGGQVHDRIGHGAHLRV